jgi:hypothetical protein
MIYFTIATLNLPTACHKIRVTWVITTWAKICQTILMKNLLIVLAFVGLALAHQPLFNSGSPTRETAFVIVNPEVSKVITAESRTNSRNWYTLEVKQDFALDVALFVGAPCPKAFAPRLYLIGRNLKESTPFAVPDGMGALLVANTWSDYSGHGVVARKSPTLEKRLDAGKYYLVVDHGASKGWYFLSLGGSEVAGGTAEGRSALSRFNRCG